MSQSLRIAHPSQDDEMVHRNEIAACLHEVPAVDRLRHYGLNGHPAEGPARRRRLVRGAIDGLPSIGREREWVDPASLAWAPAALRRPM